MSDNKKLASILSYLLLGIIWYFADKSLQKDSNVKFHVKQGLTLFIFAIIWSIFLSFLGSILFFIWGLIGLLSYVPLILAIIGIINAVNGKKKELPLIGQFGKKFTF